MSALNLKRAVVVAPNPEPIGKDVSLLKNRRLAKAVKNKSVPNLAGLSKSLAISACTAQQLGCNVYGSGTSCLSQNPTAAVLVAAGSSVQAFY
jgi:hypothetical protein